MWSPCRRMLSVLLSRVDFLPKKTVVHFAFIILLGLLITPVKASSDLVLLTAPLRTFQKHACDGEELRLECSPGTVISISLARYGRPILPPSPGGAAEPCPTTKEEYKWKGGRECLAENALTIIEKTCREQRVCRLWMSPETFQEDPCPGVRKFAEVAYKCRPVEFTNRVVCEGERLRLHCSAGYRIVIYSAMFGSVKKGTIECPQPPGVDDEDCAVSFSTENAMRVCGGRRKCSVAADVHAFGSPLCNPKTRKHLKVISTCVPQEVVTPPLFGMDYEEDESNLSDTLKPDYPLMTDPDPSRTRTVIHTGRLVTRSPWRTLYENTTFKKLEMQNDEISKKEPISESNPGDQRFVGLIAQWISANKFIAGNKEKLILYVTVSLGVGLLIFLSVVGIKLFHLRILSRKKEDISKSQDQFPADTSDYEPDERPPSRYPSRISIRRQDSDVQPRTPVTSDANHYYV